ncbi:MAG: hypothetical protein LBQ05_02620 [Christensenellaceae bacterium]|jgi:hypothetical protein|nr:hypothetical protein [Christensenellaceae bacterium]
MTEVEEEEAHNKLITSLKERIVKEWRKRGVFNDETLPIVVDFLDKYGYEQTEDAMTFGPFGEGTANCRAVRRLPFIKLKAELLPMEEEFKSLVQKVHDEQQNKGKLSKLVGKIKDDAVDYPHSVNKYFHTSGLTDDLLKDIKKSDKRLDDFIMRIRDTYKQVKKNSHGYLNLDEDRTSLLPHSLLARNAYGKIAEVEAPLPLDKYKHKFHVNGDKLADIPPERNYNGKLHNLTTLASEIYEAIMIEDRIEKFGITHEIGNYNNTKSDERAVQFNEYKALLELQARIKEHIDPKYVGDLGIDAKKLNLDPEVTLHPENLSRTSKKLNMSALVGQQDKIYFSDVDWYSNIAAQTTLKDKNVLEKVAPALEAQTNEALPIMSRVNGEKKDIDKICLQEIWDAMEKGKRQISMVKWQDEQKNSPTKPDTNEWTY